MKLQRIETERLLLRELTIDDAEHIYKTWTSDPRVTKFMSYVTHESVDVTKGWLAEVEKHNEDEDSQVLDWGFELKSTGVLIGSGGAVYKPELERWSIGYNIAVDYWNKGYTTEAARAIVEYLGSMGVKHICASHAVENPASGRVMEKIGMKFWKNGDCGSCDCKMFEAKYYILDID
ncbi:MAG: GNAT family N-acetyltransferase [Oscillospiraceae bacterium]|nr:GNAT family N-acetyltransferase [Oscillospiraceae bacterium]